MRRPIRPDTAVRHSTRTTITGTAGLLALLIGVVLLATAPLAALAVAGVLLGGLAGVLTIRTLQRRRARHRAGRQSTGASIEAGDAAAGPPRERRRPPTGDA